LQARICEEMGSGQRVVVDDCAHRDRRACRRWWWQQEE
jgi:hypothetical protein